MHNQHQHQLQRRQTSAVLRSDGAKLSRRPPRPKIQSTHARKETAGPWHMLELLSTLKRRGSDIPLLASGDPFQSAELVRHRAIWGAKSGLVAGRRDGSYVGEPEQAGPTPYQGQRRRPAA